MKEKELWIEETMKSLDSIPKVEISSELADKILKQRRSLRAKIIVMTSAQKWLVAASIFILLGINIFSVLHLLQNGKRQSASINPVYQEYLSTFNNF